MILESGAKAKTVKKYLGKGWIVQACGGHVQDLPSKGSKGSSKSMWKSEKDTLPEPPWGWTSGAEKKIKEMIKKAKKSKRFDFTKFNGSVQVQVFSRPRPTMLKEHSGPDLIP